LLVTIGAAGTRLGASLDVLAPTIPQSHVDNMDDAVRQARDFLEDGGVVLFSPAAPSFDRYRNWEERSDDFTRAVRVATSG
jgi:UDP-N-acetylmuramoylalanine--D-glutamate ligase